MSRLMSSCIVRRGLKTRHTERVKIQWHLLENGLFAHPQVSNGTSSTADFSAINMMVV